MVGLSRIMLSMLCPTLLCVWGGGGGGGGYSLATRFESFPKFLLLI